MLDPTLQTRFEHLYKVRLTERQRLFPSELAQIDSQLNKRGLYKSSMRLIQHKQAHERELEVRAIIAWESLVRVHRTFGSPITETLRDDLKEEINRKINDSYSELSWSLTEQVRKIQMQVPYSLVEFRQALIDKHDIEIDLYIDSLSDKSKPQGIEPATHIYHFYGSVGSFQTGANSVANVVQNLGVDDRQSLSDALRLVRETLAETPSIEEAQKRELLEITDECETEMAAAVPNNTKLLSMFNVLGTAIQTIASAQPAYHALKMALTPLGITLP